MINTSQIAAETDLIGNIVNAQLTATGLTLYVSFKDSKTGLARTPQATTLLFTIDKDNSKSESIVADSHSTASGVTTIIINAAGRGLPKYGVGAGSGTGVSHDIGSIVGCVNIAKPISQLAAQAVAKNGDTLTGQINFSGTDHAGIKLISLTTAERDLLTGAEGMLIKNSTTGELNQFIGGAWSAVAAGSTQANGTTTVAGKVQESTPTEIGSATAVGSTGARLFINPSSTIKTSSGASDENKLPVLNSSGTLASGFLPQDLILINAAAGEAIDGSGTPKAVYISDGTGGRTAGAFYKADADDTTNMAMNAVGFVTVNASGVGTVYGIHVGVVPGFTGLTVGTIYYTSATAGDITATATTGGQQTVGMAISTTTLLVNRKYPVPVGGGTFVTQIGTTEVQTFTLYTGYKAKRVDFNLNMIARDSANANPAYTNANGSYSPDASWCGNQVKYPAGGAVTLDYLSAPPVATGGGSDASSLTFTSVTFNANTVVLTFTAAVTAGAGSNKNSYNISATAYPY